MLQQELDTTRIRADFPVLGRKVHGHPLVYLDSAATSLKPLPMIDAMEHYMRENSATIHRSVYETAEEATERFESARLKVAELLGGVAREEVIFVRNTTEALNLVVQSYAESILKPGDAVLLSEAEHHSNLLPWQRLAVRRGIRLEFLPVTDDGELDLSGLDAVLNEGVRIVSLAQVSNVLGYELPIGDIAARAHAAGATMVVDAAQSVPHMVVHPRELGADFLAFSGHKMLGPTGIGVLYGRRDLLEAMPPFLSGGDMVGTVHLRESTYAELPAKFEAGTSAIAEAIGLGAAVDYLTGLDLELVQAHSRRLARDIASALESLPGVRIYGGKERTSVVSFNVEGIHPHDLATLADEHGVAIRAGHHCAQPLMERFGTAAMARASVYVYTRDEEVTELISAIRHAQEVFGVAKAAGGGV